MATVSWLPVVGAVALGLVAIVGGSPVTLLVFRTVDRDHGRKGIAPSVQAAGGVLRGGRAIGLLERAAVVAAMVAGWPEGIGAVIALKGLGRFAELRGDTPGTAERFLIGSFTSLLWAGVLAALARVLVVSAGLIAGP
ncbi:MAG TPA: hypothetical protein PKC73_02095 [Dermatophilaceae bacterium]|jgi:hypothetical protein|nr:hypothetical protein [Actinomycetales bacterium]HMT33538.1 hypothetical protein [Dermatophilaceae bacterium]HMT88404.1 hypothetical protein [Dermatophilaceae bacterium]